MPDHHDVSLTQALDILDLADKRHREQLVSNADGSLRKPMYGDYQLEQAVKFLKGYPRPWTVPKVIRWYATGTDDQTKAHWLRVLAASRNSRAAILLGQELEHNSLGVRVAAVAGILDYFLEDELRGGGSEDQFMYARKWWQENKESLQREAHPLNNEAIKPMTGSLTQARASGFAKLALKCVGKEYPNKLDHVMNDTGEVQSPRALHPAFYGCFDWHSSVHGHWMLVRLLKTFPTLPEAKDIRAALAQNLTAENIRVEVAYLDQKNRQSFERTYGWAWLLKLSEELTTWDDEQGKAWARNLQPLADALVARYRNFLPKQTYPIRTGVHPNTAFGLAFAWDYAKTVGDEKFAALIAERSRAYFANDANYPAAWEPGGEDFFSAALMEADLMRRVLSPAEFKTWLRKFLPGLAKGEPRALLQPATVTDRSDPKIVHLDGLNLSRAWCLKSIAAALPAADARRAVLLDTATRHAQASLPHIASGDYAGEHWLASFAVYLLSVK